MSVLGNFTISFKLDLACYILLSILRLPHHIAVWSPWSILIPSPVHVLSSIKLRTNSLGLFDQHRNPQSRRHNIVVFLQYLQRQLIELRFSRKLFDVVDIIIDLFLGFLRLYNFLKEIEFGEYPSLYM